MASDFNPTNFNPNAARDSTPEVEGSMIHITPGDTVVIETHRPPPQETNAQHIKAAIDKLDLPMPPSNVLGLGAASLAKGHGVWFPLRDQAAVRTVCEGDLCFTLPRLLELGRHEMGAAYQLIVRCQVGGLYEDEAYMMCPIGVALYGIEGKRQRLWNGEAGIGIQTSGVMQVMNTNPLSSFKPGDFLGFVPPDVVSYGGELRPHFRLPGDNGLHPSFFPMPVKIDPTSAADRILWAAALKPHWQWGFIGDVDPTKADNLLANFRPREAEKAFRDLIIAGDAVYTKSGKYPKAVFGPTPGLAAYTHLCAISGVHGLLQRLHTRIPNSDQTTQLKTEMMKIIKSITLLANVAVSIPLALFVSDAESILDSYARIQVQVAEVVKALGTALKNAAGNPAKTSDLVEWTRFPILSNIDSQNFTLICSQRMNQCASSQIFGRVEDFADPQQMITIYRA